MLQAKARKLAEIPAGLINRLSAGKVTPNMVSVAGFLLHLPVAWLIWSCYLGYAGLALAIVAPLDMLDGALARMQNSGTNFGVVLDAVLDRAKEVLLYSALAYHFASTSDSEAAALSAAVLGLSILTSYVKAKGEAAISSSSKLTAAKLNRMFGGGLLPFHIRMVILSVALILSAPVIGLLILFVGGLLSAGQRVREVKLALGSL